MNEQKTDPKTGQPKVSPLIPPVDLRRFESLLSIVESLRGPQGCPWDKEQTLRTLAPFAIEEAHELAEAIEQGSTQDVVGELGDLLLQVVLQAEVASQDPEPKSRFGIADVIASVSEKMIRRHPHVFAGAKADTSSEVLSNWAEIKKAEKKALGKKESHAFDVPAALPALARAEKIGSKTKQVKFDWPNAKAVMEKVDEEIAELKEAMAAKGKGGDAKALEHEVGDVLFSVAQAARHLKIDAEQALRTANARFERRYVAMRALVDSDSKDFSKLKTEEMEAYWSRAKALELSAL